MVYGAADGDFLNELTNRYETRILDIKTILLRPAFRFRIPLVRQNETDIFVLNIEPGIYLPLSSEKRKSNILVEHLSKKRMDWMYTSLKTSITLDLCPIFLSIGYSMTDFSHQVDKYRLTHAGFIQIRYAF